MAPTGGTIRVNRLQPRAKQTGNYLLRFAAVQPWVTDRSVLDIGAGRSFKTLHSLIASHASACLALDTDPALVEAMQLAGLDAVLADGQQFDLGKRFDTVLGLEVIEHLDNVQGFLRSISSHLSDDGILVITTPNAFRVSNFAYRIVGKGPVNDDHMAWYCHTTLRQALDRNGFRVIQAGYVPHRTPGRIRGVLSRTVRLFLPPELANNTILVVACLKQS